VRIGRDLKQVETKTSVIVTIFRWRLPPEHAAEYATIAAKMNALVQTMPGYVSHKTFAAG
jgi:heme-degrading monooxygenase HmoA